MIHSDGRISTELIRYGWKNYKTIYLKPIVNKKTGYVSHTLGFNKKQTTYYVHRIVAQAFIPNPDNKPCINHKDGNKQNNCVENLEWCTYSENHKHSYDELSRLSSNLGKNLGGGVCFRKDRNYWIAYCDYLNKRKYLGSFKSEQEARYCLNEYNTIIGKPIFGKT